MKRYRINSLFLKGLFSILLLFFVDLGRKWCYLGYFLGVSCRELEPLR